MTTLNLDYARKMEGVIYDEGAADLAVRVALAAAGRTTSAGRAKAVAKVLRDYCIETGMNPDIEVVLRAPGDHRYVGSDGWYVGLEAGPYGWAIVASDACCQLGVFCEPYYSFDLVFYKED